MELLLTRFLNIHFHIKGTSYSNGQVKQVEFFEIWNQQVSSSPSLQCLVGQIQVQKSTPIVTKNLTLAHI